MEMQTPTAQTNSASQARVLANFGGHTGAVTALAFSPDRRLLASGARDGSGRIWDVASSKPGERASFRVSEGVRALAFAPNGRLLAAGSSNGTVLLFDVAEKGAAEIRTLRGGQRAIDAVAFSPDGKLIAGVGEDQTLRVWEPATAGANGEARTLLPGHTKPIRAMAFAPDGLGVATAAHDGTVRVWTLSRIRSSQRTALPHTIGADTVAYSPDGKTAATAGPDGAIRVWDLTAIKPTVKREIATPTGAIRLVLFSPDGEVLVGVGGNRVTNWEVRTGQPRTAWELPAGAAVSFAFTPDGRYLARGTAEGAVDVYRVAEKRSL